MVAQLVRSLLQGKQQQRTLDLGPTLPMVLQPAVVEKLFDDPSVVARLAPYLPEPHRNNPHKLRELLRSP